MIYPTTTIAVEDRDQDGMYPIDPGNLHIFPFQVPYAGAQTITLQHAMPNSQDWSVSVSVVVGANDTPVALSAPNNNEFNLDRTAIDLVLWAEGAGPEGSIQLDPSKQYYLKVLNLQSKPNGYIASFSF